MHGPMNIKNAYCSTDSAHFPLQYIAAIFCPYSLVHDTQHTHDKSKR